VRFRAARVSKRPLIRRRRRSLTVAARKLRNYLRAISALASRARKQATTNQKAATLPQFHGRGSLRAARISKRSAIRQRTSGATTKVPYGTKPVDVRVRPI